LIASDEKSKAKSERLERISERIVHCKLSCVKDVPVGRGAESEVKEVKKLSGPSLGRPSSKMIAKIEETLRFTTDNTRRER